MTRKPSKTLNYEKAARSDLRLVQCEETLVQKTLTFEKEFFEESMLAGFLARVDFIGFDNKESPPWENAVKIGKWSGTFMAKLKLP
jgi:hypothetical protein